MIILRQKQYSKIGELRNKVIRNKAAKMIKTANKELHKAKDSTIRKSTEKINRALTSNNPESKKNERLEMLWKNRKKKLDNIESHKDRIEKNISEIQEKFPKGSSISRDDFKYGKKILDRHKRENVYYNQRNYTWSEFGKAAKSIGIGALVGAGGGLAMAGRKYEKTGEFDKTGGFIRAGIGAGLGALAGAGIYRIGHKERLKAKEKIEKLEAELGKNIFESIKENLPKTYPNLVKLSEDLEKLRKNVNVQNLADLSGCYIRFNVMNFNNSSDLSDYLSSYDLTKEEIPIAEIDTVSFGDTIDQYIIYNIKSKRFYSRAYKINNEIKTSLNKYLLDCLESIKYFVEDGIENEKNSALYDLDDLDEEYRDWKKEYYEKAKNIIKQVRI